MRAHWKQFLALFFAIAVAITSGVIVTTRNFQAAEKKEVHHHTKECAIDPNTGEYDIYCTIPVGSNEAPLICTLEEDYALSCGYDDAELIDYHFHNQDCYGEDGNLACGQEEFQERHYHNDATCFSGHKHSDLLGCYGEKNHSHDTKPECCYNFHCGKVEGQEYPVEGTNDTFNFIVKYYSVDYNTGVPTLIPGAGTSVPMNEDGSFPNGTITTTTPKGYNAFDSHLKRGVNVDDKVMSNVDEAGELDSTLDDFKEFNTIWGPWEQPAHQTDIIRGFIPADGVVTDDMVLQIYCWPEVEEDEESADAELTINYVYRGENGQLVPIPEKDSVTKKVAEGDYDFTEDKEIPGYKYESGIPEEGVKLLKGDKKEVTLEFSKVADAKIGKLVVAIRPDGDTHNGDNYTMDNGSKFFDNGNYVHPFWEEEVDFNQYFTSTDAITNTSGLANSQIKGVLTPALTGEIESRLAAGQLQPGQKLSVMLNGSYQDITFDPAIHEIIYTNLNWRGSVLHLDGVIKFKNEVDLSYDSNLPAKTNGKTLATDRSPLTGATVDFTVRDGNDIGIKSSDGKEYVFVGWNTKADGSGSPHAPGSTISISTNTTLYAQWEEKKPEVNVIIRYVDKDKNILKTERDAGTIKAGVDPTTLITADDIKDIEKDGRTYTNSDAGTKITEENGNTVVTLVFGLQNITEVRWVNEEGKEIKGPKIDTNYDESKYPAGDTVQGTDGKTYVTKKPSDPETKENGDQTVTIECVEKVVDVTINFVDKEGNPIPGKDPVVLRDQKVGTDITESVTRESNQTIPVKKDGKDYEYKFVGVLDKEYKVQSDNNVINLEFDPEDITVYNLKVNYWKSELSGQNKLQDSRIVPINDGVLAIPEGEGVKNADGTITPSLITPAVSGYLPYKFEVRNGDFKGQDWAEVVNAVKAFDSTIVYDDVEKTFVVPAGFNPKALAIALKDIVPSQNYEVDVYYAPYTVANGGGTNSSQPGTTPGGGQPTGTQPGNTTPTPNPPQVQNNTPVQPGNVTPVQPGNTTPVQPGNTTPNQPANTTPNAQPQAETPSLINANGQTPAAPVQAEDATLNNAAIPGVTPAPEAAVADEASATSSTSYVPAATPTAVPADNVIALAMEQTPTGNVQLTQVDDIEAALADFNFGHVCNILYFLIIAGTIVVLANYFRMSKKHSKRVFELRGELGEDDPYKKN